MVFNFPFTAEFSAVAALFSPLIYPYLLFIYFRI